MAASRSVAKRPVATVLTVIPVGGDLARQRLEEADQAAIRCALESARPGIGSRTEVEPTLTIRPQPRSRIPGSTASIRTRGASTSDP